MITLILFWIVGLLISELVTWVSMEQPSTFNIKNRYAQLLLSVVLGVVASFFAWKFKLSGMIPWIIFIIGGFAVGAIISWLIGIARKINKEK